MSLLKNAVVAVALSATLVLAGCAPASPAHGPASPANGPAAGATRSPIAGSKPVAPASSLPLVDLCQKLPVSTVASIIGLPYAETANEVHTATASGCNYEGAGGVKSVLILGVTMQTGATKSNVDAMMAAEADDGEHAVQLHGMGDYAVAESNLVAVLYGSTVVTATNVFTPSPDTTITTAQLRQVIAAAVAAAKK